MLYAYNIKKCNYIAFFYFFCNNNTYFIANKEFILSLVQLNNRNTEILKDIPKNYRTIIVNNIIAKSIDSGMFFKEAGFILSSSELNFLMENNSEINIQVKEKTYQSKVKKVMKKKFEDSGIFAGFD